MKTSLVLLALLLPVAGCGDSADAATTHEGVARQIAGTIEEMVEVLDGVTDEATAEAAKAKMEDFGARFKALAERVEELGEPDPATVERLNAEMESTMQKLTARMQDLAAKAMSNPHVRDVLEALGSVMADMPEFGK